jgi:predicted Rossmann fold nucleotide-binding protein DprA/Smf involved in DNA uptake
MSTPEKESIAVKFRSIEVALDNFRSRMQSSLCSQVSLLKEKVENTNAKLAAATSKSGSTQVNADLSAIIQETKSILQKDLLHDTIELFNEKLTELESLTTRLKTLSTDQNKVEIPPIVQERIMHKSFPNSLRNEAREPNDDKDNEITSLREEVNRLYNLTEREPRFQPFWILRDAYPDSVHITKMARQLNVTPSEVLENLKIFERLGLIEIKEGEARTTKLVRPNKPRTDMT